jgi:predicted RNA-binding protein with RPS1 domain
MARVCYQRHKKRGNQSGRRLAAKLLSKDEARRIAASIANLPAAPQSTSRKPDHAVASRAGIRGAENRQQYRQAAGAVAVKIKANEQPRGLSSLPQWTTMS